MKTTKSDLKRIIAEEIKSALKEQGGYDPYEGMHDFSGRPAVRHRLAPSTAQKKAPDPRAAPESAHAAAKRKQALEAPGPEKLLADALTNIKAALEAIKSSKAS